MELHPDKIRRIEFERFAEQNRERRGEGKPETFDFPGIHANQREEKVIRAVQGEAQDDPQRVQPADLQVSGYSQQMQDRLSSGNDKGVRHEIPRGITAVGAFLFFGTIMASLAGATLSWPGTSFDKIWALNPTAHKQLASLGKPIGILFLFLSVALALAGTGWFKRRLWGWRLAAAVIATQVLGDLVNFFRGDWLRGGVGFSIATALLVYLLRPAVRAVFNGAILP